MKPTAKLVKGHLHRKVQFPSCYPVTSLDALTQ